MSYYRVTRKKNALRIDTQKDCSHWYFQNTEYKARTGTGILINQRQSGRKDSTFIQTPLASKIIHNRHVKKISRKLIEINKTTGRHITIG